MQFFEQTLIVQTEHIDELNHVNNVQYLNWVNEIAKAHWLQVAPKSILKTHFWVVASHIIKYKDSAVLNDQLLLKTYVSESKGIISNRIVEIYQNNTQKLIATCETQWCFMSYQTKRPARIPSEISNLFK